MSPTGRVCFIALAFRLSSVADAQSASPPRDSRGIILGTVTDTGLAPIANAELEFVGTTLHVTTDARGRFAVTDLPPTTYLVAARRVAFQPTVNIAEIRGGDTLRLALMLQASVTTLTPVVVKERAASAKLRDFEDRRRAGVGEFFTLEQIERRNAVGVIDLLRQSKTVTLKPVGLAYYAMSRRNLAYECPMQIYVDGVPLGKIDVLQLPSPKELMGIEIYSGAATAPMTMPLGPQNAHPGCGVIMLWTRDGSDDPAPRNHPDSSGHGIHLED